MRSPSQTRLQRGFSLLEMMVVTAVTAVIMVIILSLIDEATRLSLFIESRNELSVMAQRPLNVLQREIIQSNNVFGEDALGTPYRAAMTAILVAADPQPVPNSLLPVIAPAGTMLPDAVGVRNTGNALLIARKVGPLRINVPASALDAANFPAVTFFADRYVFHYYYLARMQNRARAFRAAPYLLNLYRLRSAPVADYFQLANSTSNMDAGQRTALSTALRAAGTNLTMAWNPGGTFTNSFYTIDPNLTFAAGPIAQPRLTRRDVISMMPELVGGRISGKMPMTVAYRFNSELLDPQFIDLAPPNAAEPATLAGRGKVPVPRFGNINDLESCGFEVKVVGPPGSRQVMTRLVLYSNYGVSKLDAQEGIVISAFNRT
jgi:prepilin-type N-terminal cleavage/methylation domain-containing protein